MSIASLAPVVPRRSLASSTLRTYLAGGLLAALSACSGAQWQNVQVSPGYHPPKEVEIAVVSKTPAQHNDEALKVLSSSLASDLAGRGIKATFVTAPTSAASAGVDLVEWDQGVRALRWLGVGGRAHVIVVVNSPSADGSAGLNGTAEGYVRGGFFGGNSYNAASEAGSLIARAIATGKTD